MGSFDDVLHELGGSRAVMRASGEVILHFGNIRDPEDPHWQVVNQEIAEELLADLHACFRS